MGSAVLSEHINATFPTLSAARCRVMIMEQPTNQAETSQPTDLKFYGPADELPPGAIEALKRRTPEQLQASADRATRRT
jgi:hypothetical protein